MSVTQGCVDRRETFSAEEDRNSPTERVQPTCQPSNHSGLTLSKLRDAMSSSFSSYINDRRDGFHWKTLAAVTVGIGISVVAGLLVRWRTNHGVKALHPGMDQDRVVAALGRPSYAYKCEPSRCSTVRVDAPLEESYTSDDRTWPRTCLMYKQGPKKVMTVEFDGAGIIHERNVLEIEGPEEEWEAYELAAFAVTHSANHPLSRSRAGLVFAFPVPPCAAAFFTWEATAPKPLRADDVSVVTLNSNPTTDDSVCGVSSPLALLNKHAIKLKVDEYGRQMITAVSTTNPSGWIKLEDVDGLAASGGREDFKVVEHYEYSAAAGSIKRDVKRKHFSLRGSSGTSLTSSPFRSRLLVAIRSSVVGFISALRHPSLAEATQA